MSFWDFANNNPITALFMVAAVFFFGAIGIGNLGPFVVHNHPPDPKKKPKSEDSDT